MCSQFKLEQLVMSAVPDLVELGTNFALFLYRTDKHLMLEDIVDSQAARVLQKRESMENWQEFERTKREFVETKRELNEKII